MKIFFFILLFPFLNFSEPSSLFPVNNEIVEEKQPCELMGPLKPDLIIKNIKVISCGSNEPTVFTITVQNNWHATSPMTTLIALVEYCPFQFYSPCVAVRSLDFKESETYTFTTPSTCSFVDLHYAMIDHEFIVDEHNENNNMHDSMILCQ